MIYFLILTLVFLLVILPVVRRRAILVDNEREPITDEKGGYLDVNS